MTAVGLRGLGRAADVIFGAAKGESLIYRAASGTPASMTPRVVDVKGLSAADSLANALLERIKLSTPQSSKVCAPFAITL